jgi:hypothetical protein
MSWPLPIVNGPLCGRCVLHGATARAARLVGIAAITLAVGCGASAPSIPPASPLAASAESAPLPELGSSFVDAPLAPEETAPADHSGHGGHQGHGGHAH